MAGRGQADCDYDRRFRALILLATFARQPRATRDGDAAGDASLRTLRGSFGGVQTATTIATGSSGGDASAGANGGQERKQDGCGSEDDMRTHGQNGRTPDARLITTQWSTWRSAKGCLNGSHALGRACGGCEKDQRHSQAGHGQQERAGSPRHAGHVSGQVGDPGQQACGGQREMRKVPCRRARGLASCSAALAAAGDPSGHHPQAKADGDQPCAESNQAQRRPAGLAACRGRHLELVALLGHGGDQVLEELARLRYARALAGLSLRTGSRRVQRTGDREVDLGSRQPLACGWEDGNRDVMPDGVATELDARLHRSPRSRRLMGAPGGGKPRKRNSGDREGRGCMDPPPGYAHAHTVKLITPVRSALTCFGRGHD